MSRYHIFTALVTVFLASCSTYSPWKPTQEDALWGPHHDQVIMYQRTEYPSPLMVVGAPSQPRAWKLDGRYLDISSVSDRITDYLKDIGYVDQQAFGGGVSDGISERVARNRFFIVSLKPIVVIMTPYAYGSVDGKSNSELEGHVSDQLIGSFPLINGYHYGSKVYKSSNYQWFSPDLKSGIQPVPKQGANWVIENKKFHLLISPSKSGSWDQVERLR